MGKHEEVGVHIKMERRKESQVHLDDGSGFTHTMTLKFESRIPRSVRGSKA